MTSGLPPRHATAAAIRFHYDVGTDFYRLWLDPTLTYSAALWNGEPSLADDAADLREAQLRKLDFAVAQARARGVSRVLDVGCGWGGLLRRAVEAHGVGRATGLTLSDQQLEHVEAQRLAGVEVALQSFAEHRPQRAYDALFCIGAMEHFARPELAPSEKLQAYRTFFEWAADVLLPGRYLYLQTIAYGAAERAQSPTFLQREIFPESDLPRLWEISRAADGLFELVLLRNDRQDYERTVKLWDRALRRRQAQAAELSSQDTVKRYRTYLRLAAIGFHTGALALYRVTLRRL